MVINHQSIGIYHDLYTYKEHKFCGTFWDDTPIIPAMARRKIHEIPILVGGLEHFLFSIIYGKILSID